MRQMHTRQIAFGPRASRARSGALGYDVPGLGDLDAHQLESLKFEREVSKHNVAVGAVARAVRRVHGHVSNRCLALHNRIVTTCLIVPYHTLRLYRHQSMMLTVGLDLMFKSATAAEQSPAVLLLQLRPGFMRRTSGDARSMLGPQRAAGLQHAQTAPGQLPEVGQCSAQRCQ